jgi:vancomycin resistance protein YoaR
MPSSYNALTFGTLCKRFSAYKSRFVRAVNVRLTVSKLFGNIIKPGDIWRAQLFKNIIKLG